MSLAVWFGTNPLFQLGCCPNVRTHPETDGYETLRVHRVSCNILCKSVQLLSWMNGREAPLRTGSLANLPRPDRDGSLKKQASVFAVYVKRGLMDSAI